MEKEKIEMVTDMLENRKNLPFEVKRKIIKNIFLNCIFLVIMVLITLTINILFNKLSIRTFASFIDIFRICCAIVSIGILEVAFRKDSGKMCIYGFEFLVFSICILFVPYMYISKENIYFLRFVILGFGIYYILKSYITFWNIRHNYLKDNISDIKELVKDEKKGYIDEKSSKTIKNQNSGKKLKK